MGVLRAFIAIDLPIEVRQNLAKVMHKLQRQLEGYPVRWVTPGNIHLTLKFLGDVSEHNLSVLTHLLEGEVQTHPPFEFSVGQVGAFPDVRRPRVIWVGVEAPDELFSLQRGIDQAMAKLGYAHERRTYQPHLTLGRVARNASGAEVRAIGHYIQKAHVGFLGSVRATEVHLYRSDLEPTGPAYTRLFTSQLNFKAPPAIL